MPTTEAIYQAAISDARKPGQIAQHLAERILTNRLLYGRRQESGNGDGPGLAGRVRELIGNLAGDPVLACSSDARDWSPVRDDQLALLEAMAEKGLLGHDEVNEVRRLVALDRISAAEVVGRVDASLSEGFARRLAGAGTITPDQLEEMGLTQTGRGDGFSAERARAVFETVPNKSNGMRPGLFPLTYGQAKTLFELTGDPKIEFRSSGHVAALAAEQGRPGELPAGLFMSLDEADALLRENQMYPRRVTEVEKHGFRIVADTDEIAKLAPWAKDATGMAVCEVSPSMIDQLRGVFLRSGIDMRAEQLGPDAGAGHEGNWTVSVERDRLISGIAASDDFQKTIEQACKTKGVIGRPDVKVSSTPAPEPQHPVAPSQSQRHKDISKDISLAKEQASGRQRAGVKPAPKVPTPSKRSK